MMQYGIPRAVLKCTEQCSELLNFTLEITFTFAEAPMSLVFAISVSEDFVF